jgi:hypothetical protein
VVVVDLADPDVVRWPAYGPVMLAHQIAVCTRCWWWWPASMGAPWTCFGLTPVCWVPSSWPVRWWWPCWPRCPLLDLLAEDLQAAVADPDRDSWAELNTLSRAEVSQAAGMLVAQLEVDRPRPWCGCGRTPLPPTAAPPTSPADILDRRLRLQVD